MLISDTTSTFLRYFLGSLYHLQTSFALKSRITPCSKAFLASGELVHQRNSRPRGPKSPAICNFGPSCGKAYNWNISLGLRRSVCVTSRAQDEAFLTLFEEAPSWISHVPTAEVHKRDVLVLMHISWNISNIGASPPSARSAEFAHAGHYYYGTPKVYPLGLFFAQGIHRDGVQ